MALTLERKEMVRRISSLFYRTYLSIVPTRNRTRGEMKMQ